MDAKTAQSVFGGAPATRKRASKEEHPINYKSTNESLVKKILLYKQQLTQCSKTIEKLREENMALRQRNQQLVEAADEKKIEIIVEQRVQSRLSHAAVLQRKLVQVLQQAGSEMEGLFKEVEPKQCDINSRRMPKPEINLDRVDESPIRRNEQGTHEEIEHNALNVASAYSAQVDSMSSTQSLENGTPRKRINSNRGRRSELFQDLNSVTVDDTITQESDPPAAVSRRAPMIIAPAATPGAGNPIKKVPTSVRRRKSVDKFKKPSTPAPVAQPESSEVTDSFQVRRQRSAKMNIKTLKEPSLGQKLRRPGKHDEPMPYIDTFF